MKGCWFVIISLFSCSLFSADTPTETLVFEVSSPGSPPYLYFDTKKRSYEGLVVELIEPLSFKKGGFKVKYVDSSRKRSEQHITENKTDLLLSSKDWLSNPEAVLISEPIIDYPSYLYSLKPFHQGFELDDIRNKRICTRLGFAYPGLEKYFAAKKALRVDVSSKFAAAKMLLKGRCDYSIMNNYNASVVFAVKDFCEKIVYQSPFPTNKVGLSLVLSRAKAQYLEQINHQIKEYKTKGELEQAIVKHINITEFPSRIRCY